MNEGKDFILDEKMKAISLTEDGIEKAEKVLGVGNIYTEKGIKYVHHLETAIRAKALFHKDKEYVVKNGEIIIVDEFTGRMMPGRRWSEGSIKLWRPKKSYGAERVAHSSQYYFPKLFQAIRKIGRMTGTALTSAEEFHKVYKLETINIPTNKSLIRKDETDLVFQTVQGKFKP